MYHCQMRRYSDYRADKPFPLVPYSYMATACKTSNVT